MKKITNPSQMRDNLKYERAYEKKHKEERLKTKRPLSKKRMQARRLIEKSTGRPIPKWKTVDHIKPLSKWWSNKLSNLRVVSKKVNYKKGSK